MAAPAATLNNALSSSAYFPYVELARLHKPAGLIAVLTPYPLGTLLAGVIEAPSLSVSRVFSRLFLLSFTLILLRSAGCAWNDAVDCKLDRQVKRSRLRPVARGSISPKQARLFALALFVFWLAPVAALLGDESLPAFWLALANGPLVAAYPYAKRVTDYPQIFLGVTLAWGIVTSYVATARHDLRYATGQEAAWTGIGFLVLAYVAWTVMYDTVYAYQDIRDDERAGVRSTALAWGNYGKVLLAVAALVQVLCLSAAGSIIGASNWYFVFSPFGSASLALGMLFAIDLKEPKACAVWFKRDLYLGGSLMCLGLVAEFIYRIR